MFEGHRVVVELEAFINFYLNSIWVGSVERALSRRKLQIIVNLFFMLGMLILGLMIPITSIIYRPVILNCSSTEEVLTVEYAKRVSIMNLNCS